MTWRHTPQWVSARLLRGYKAQPRFDTGEDERHARDVLYPKKRAPESKEPQRPEPTGGESRE